ncbi:MAG: response regulator [Lachnospiraceae bacterium]|nr:response regulator [Lachnospiraceae bacterium]
MIKLLIVDDERIIRETIASLIDWNALGMTVIGTAENGIEAYNMILDEYPEIILTDIKMPGFSGLDLIQRIKEISPETQFVILSGYGEFEYAQRAMQYGVKHYLLKPCNEEQIIASLTSAKTDYLKAAAAKDPTANSSALMKQMIMKNILASALQEPLPATEAILPPYENYISITQTSYTLFYVYYIENENFLFVYEELKKRTERALSDDFPLYAFYVKGTFIFFYPSDDSLSSSVQDFLIGLKELPIGRLSEYRKVSFDNLPLLISELTRHIRHYESIYQMDGHAVLPIYNHNSVIKEMYQAMEQAFSVEGEGTEEALSNLFRLIDDISDLYLLKQQASSLVIQAVSKQASPDMSDAMQYLVNVHQLQSCDSVRLSLRAKLTEYFNSYHASLSPSSLSQRIITYTEQNLEKPGLSLKWLAENYLFMNVDYISKRFAKETGLKFSKYLNDLRIQKAKYYMEAGSYTIHEIAELVGCGQNPQYFSQIFKKNTGLSPSQYLSALHEPDDGEDCTEDSP